MHAKSSIRVSNINPADSGTGPSWITLVSTAPLMTLVLLKSHKWGFYEVHLPKVNLQHDFSTHW